jgi:hypothetical protein
MLETFNDDGVKRTFSTGATRDTAVGKIDPEGFVHPLFMLQFYKYMNMHRIQSDGTLRDSDNWQKGIPKEVCAKSLKRHMLDFELIHRGCYDAAHEPCIIAAAMGIMFNVQAYVLQVIQEIGLRDFDGGDPIPETIERLEKLGFKSLEEFNASKS